MRRTLRCIEKTMCYVLIVLLACPLNVFSQPAAAKPEAAVAPVSVVGDISEAEQKILLNRLRSNLSRHYRLVSQANFIEAQEKVFEDMDVENCTEDHCIRKIQDLLQVENLFVLQVVKYQEVVQLSLSMATLSDKKVVDDICKNCRISRLYAKVDDIVRKMIGVETPSTAKQTPPSTASQPIAKDNHGRLAVSSLPLETGAQIYIDGELKGRIPSLPIQLAPGTYDVEVKGKDRTGQTTVTVEAGVTRTITVKIENEEESFFSKYKWWILGGVVVAGGAAAAAGGGGGGSSDGGSGDGNTGTGQIGLDW